MSLFRKISTIVFATFTVLAYGQQDTLPQPATLSQCVDYAVKNNISVNQSIVSKNSAVVDRREAWGNFLPYVGASGNYSNNQGFSFDSNTNQRVTSTQQGMSVGLSAQLNLFNGLKDINAYRRSQLSLAAAEYSNEKIINDISLNVVNAYLTILAALEYEKVTVSQYELSKMQVDRIEKLVKAGSKAQGDLFEVQATLARDEQSMVDAKNQVVLAYLTLKQLLALNITTKLDIVTSGYDNVTHSSVLNSSPLEIYRSAELNLPEIQKAKKDIEVSQRSLAIAKGQFSPTLSFSYGWNNSFIFDYKNPATGDPISISDQWKNNSRQSFGMSLSIPIFNRMSTITGVQRSKLSIMQSEFALAQARLDLQQKVEKAYADATSSYKSFIAAQKAAYSSVEALRYATNKFEIGKLSVYDYETAKTQLLKSQTDVLRTKFDYIFKTFLLEFYKTQKIEI